MVLLLPVAQVLIAFRLEPSAVLTIGGSNTTILHVGREGQARRKGERTTMKKALFLFGFLMLTLVCVTGLSAQQSQKSQDQQAGSSQLLIAKADALKGTDVTNEKGEKLGKVDSVNLDLGTGKISYVAIDPGSGDRLVPVPFDMFGVTRGKNLILKMDKNRFAQAPNYPKNNQPNWADAGWTNWVSGFWGTAPSGVMTAQAGGKQQAVPPGAHQQPQQMGAQQQPPPQQQPMQQSQQQPSTGQQQPQQMGTQQPSQQPMRSQPSQ